MLSSWCWATDAEQLMLSSTWFEVWEPTDSTAAIYLSIYIYIYKIYIYILILSLFSYFHFINEILRIWSENTSTFLFHWDHLLLTPHICQYRSVFTDLKRPFCVINTLNPHEIYFESLKHKHFQDSDVLSALNVKEATRRNLDNKSQNWISEWRDPQTAPGVSLNRGNGLNDS